jgi:uncharacterized membrane protein
MERIEDINNKCGGQLFMCFDKTRLHIAIYNGRDSFQVSTKAAEFADYDKLKERFRQEIRYLTDILDEFMENEKVYRGE